MKAKSEEQTLVDMWEAGAILREDLLRDGLPEDLLLPPKKPRRSPARKKAAEAIVGDGGPVAVRLRTVELVAEALEALS